VTHRAVFGVLVCALIAPGCSLSRSVLGGSRGDAGIVPLDGTVLPDAWTPGADVGPPIDAWAPTSDAGGCNADGDCPPDLMIEGTCAYADGCATSAPDPGSSITHYACVAHVCTPTVTSLPMTCSRETDGDPCDGGSSCGECSASACGATGSRSCSGPMCLGGVCQSVVTVMPCTTPDDMCGSLSDWSPCYYSLTRGRCVETRSWGACALGTCIGGAGHTEARDCSC
jgi:hypothetical protein